MKIRFFVLLLTVAIVLALTASFFLGFFFLNARLVDALTEKDIPAPLLLKLRFSGEKPGVALAQHGLHHDEFLSAEEMLEGARLLTQAGLSITYYVPPYESRHNLEAAPFPVLAALRPEETVARCRSNSCVEAGPSTLLRPSNPAQNLPPQFAGVLAPLFASEPARGGEPLSQVVIHVQDPLSEVFLEWATDGQVPDVLRMDDLNTDIVDIRTQIDRINVAEDFCARKGCTLVLAIIPLVERRSQGFFTGNALLAFSTALILALYLFYFISYLLKKTAGKVPRLAPHGPHDQRRDSHL